ncbi:MAG: hypothetical protein CBC48_21470 [bacterium TMED88]|nr:hypothetical protein [Deltaproteobacteria bacterium]OUV19759.1 MAG: hypothetical protein CBC48_21470 [bacterium TMED88]
MIFYACRNSIILFLQTFLRFCVTDTLLFVFRMFITIFLAIFVPFLVTPLNQVMNQGAFRTHC